MKSRATQTKELDMVNGPLARKILIYSIPLMFSNLLQVFFNMTDVAVVGKFAGARALGSVGSTTIIITLTTGILLGMGGGVNAVTALHMGAEDYQRVHKTVHTSVILCFIAGLLLLVAGLAFSKPLLATVYKGNIIKNLIMDCQSYTKYRPNETTGGIFVSWRRKEELPTGA